MRVLFMEEEVVVEEEKLLFPEELTLKDGGTMFFFFECNECREQWFSTFGKCPRCHREDFQILDAQAAKDAKINMMLLNDQIHYVFLTE
jgi:Zn finger protein HypA/HybF involved in hydrogenase expression